MCYISLYESTVYKPLLRIGEKGLKPYPTLISLIAKGIEPNQISYTSSIKYLKITIYTSGIYHFTFMDRDTHMNTRFADLIMPVILPRRIAHPSPCHLKSNLSTIASLQRPNDDTMSLSRGHRDLGASDHSIIIEDYLNSKRKKLFDTRETGLDERQVICQQMNAWKHAYGYEDNDETVFAEIDDDQEY